MNFIHTFQSFSYLVPCAVLGVIAQECNYVLVEKMQLVLKFNLNTLQFSISCMNVQLKDTYFI